ncbi:serine hydrolase domain-containing protein [Plastoroseomonas hellenica]|uniref:serine hydrolase domain-containing protein n=1 Tax=Plastoroseomonas hellenica TaxID=2687306 RepID=UPI001BA58257|nr:serine hydrolase [Plastoroseomonas hellenica]MBR0647327.1 serine hydrolase [Plastoroseomonas hellenica]
MHRRDVLASLLIAAGWPALAADEAWPGTEWDRITPEAAGWRPDLLAEARAYAQRAGTASFIVLQHGRIIESWGDITSKLQLYSVRKSLLSALIGIAVRDGRLNLDDTMAALGIDDVPPSLTEVEKQATVRQLLQARSGIYHPALYETEGMARRRPARGSHAPGRFWYYNNWDFNALGTIYERATGTTIFQAFQAEIAGPLGMQDYRPSDGRSLGGEASMHAAYPFRMSARDLARFGLLYLRQGRWRDRQVVPAAWVRESTTAWSETYLRSGYGYMWWTGFPDRRVTIMNLPPGGFWADGSRGQFVVVDPAHDLVAVHQTDGTSVSERQMGHILWLILNAAGVQDPGADPEAG